MPDYKITRISEQPPREWANPKGGTVYYRNVMLDGWEKPVSIGKKSPDALQVGMTVSGTIERTGGETDKWHGAPMGSFGGGASQAGSVAQERVPFKADPDRQAEIKAEWAIGQGVQLYNAIPYEIRKTIDGEKAIEARAIELFAMVDRVKGGSTGGAVAPTAAAPVTTQATGNPQSSATGYEKFKQTGAKLADKREDEAIHEQIMEYQDNDELPPGF